MTKKLVILTLTALATLFGQAQAQLQRTVIIKPFAVQFANFEPVENTCAGYAKRYGFNPDEKDRRDNHYLKCEKFRLSDYRAWQRIRELRAVGPSGYCNARREFVDAQALKYWALKDFDRIAMLETTPKELDDLIMKKAIHFGVILKKRLANGGDFKETNCGVFLWTDNYVFNETPGISATDFGHIYGDVNTIHGYFASTGRLLPPLLPTLADREAAEKEFERTHPEQSRK